MEKIKLWSIQYKTKNGETEYYMNIGSNTEKEAHAELERILKRQADYKNLGIINKQTERSEYKIVERNLHKITKS